jgi:cytochrome P450
LTGCGGGSSSRLTEQAGEEATIDKSFDQHLLTPAYLADPYPYYHQLRCEAPVYWSEAMEAWLLTRYGDAEATLRDPRLVSGTRIAAAVRQLPETVQPEVQALEGHISTWMGFIDPPDHTRLRALVSNAFTPRMIRGLGPRIQTIVDELLDRVQEAGRMDLIADFAFPLPAIVIAEMLGLPPEDREQFKQWSNDVMAFLGTGRSRVDVARRAQQGVYALKDYLRGIFRQRRQLPREDLISALLVVEEEGDRLSEEEMFGMCVFLLVAGHETTLALIGNGMLALLRNPEQKQMLQENPGLIDSAVEEFLRYDSPIQHQTRVAREDFELEGQRILRGDRVLPMLGAANRDPAQFADPDRLDIRRQPNPHLAFGYGIHFCLGAPLARLEGQIAIHTILRRLPRMQLTDGNLRWRVHTSMRHPELLPVGF